MVGQPITAISKFEIDGGLPAADIGLFGIKTFLNYAHFDNSKNAGNATTGQHNSSGKDTASGVMLSFKPRLYFDETATVVDAAGNTDFYHYIIDVDDSKTVEEKVSKSLQAKSAKVDKTQAMKMLKQALAVKSAQQQTDFVSDLIKKLELKDSAEKRLVQTLRKKLGTKTKEK
jgi:hypothetical protein